MLYFDPIYILFIAPGLILGLAATLLLKYWGNEFKSIQSINHVSGAELVNKIGTLYNLDIKLNVMQEDFGDNYDTRSNTITLSNTSAYGSSITSLAVTAHELGHALQYKQKSPLILFRNFLVPIVNIGTNIGYFMIIIGFVLSIIRISELGLILFSLSTLFTLLTLPIEIDASNKAFIILKQSDILFEDEMVGAKKVLSAAVLTYVAALLQSITQVLYFFFRIKRK